MSSSSSPTSSFKPTLHVLKLPENPVIVNETDGTKNYERFDMAWVLIVKDPATSTPLYPKKDDETTPAPQNDETVMIKEGDAIYFPELLTGAREFEGLRFVGTQLNEGEMRLLKGGIESPEFPQDISQMVHNNNMSLRDAYEDVLYQMLQAEQPAMSLDDILGGKEDEFWSSPPIQRQNERRLTAVQEWKIRLDQCEVLPSTRI